MATTSLVQLKQWFKKGIKPTELQFAAWMDSYWHKDEALPLVAGKSAYELALLAGFIGTEAEWLASLQGADGYTPQKGTDYTDGIDGKSAYELAVLGGFIGTEAEWLASLPGADGYTPQKGTDYTDGVDGKSAYELAVIDGFVGTEAEWLASLQGADGTTDELLGYALSDQTNDISTGLKLSDRIPYAFSLTKVKASLQTAATGGSFTIDIKKNGVSIFTTKLTFDSGETTTETASVPCVLATSTFANDDVIEFYVDNVGSVTAGKGLIVKLIGTK